ncbi:MAG TPA: DUF892 family protein [Lacipirellulaceae bacterium]|nr:DUF892 family protein [Lacipirellulaceae bacterium]HMP04940.1 DUF892 family protein [Lacipirellulaceae bacterium]
MTDHLEHSLYVSTLKDLYSAENQLLRILPKMAKVASAPPLRQALTEQMHQAQVHLHRIDNIFAKLGVGPKGGEFLALQELIVEARHVMGQSVSAIEADADLIGLIQRIQHLAAAGYAPAQGLARKLGYSAAAESLELSLNEKTDANSLLAALITPAARAEGQPISTTALG